MRGRDRAARKAKDGGPPPSLGGQVCDFIEAYAVHGDGDFRGEPLRLHGDFEQMIWRMYELRPAADPRPGRPDWTNRWAEVVNVGPKDTGKSLTAAAIGLADAFGPVEFDGWDAHGDPVGRPRKSVRVVCVSTEEAQAKNSYGPLVHMIDPDTCSPAFLDEFGEVDTGIRGVIASTRVLLPDNRGVILPVSSGAASKEGGKASLIILEEPHLMRLPELHELYAAYKRTLIKREGAMLMMASNFFDPTERSVLQVAVEAIESDAAPRSLLVGNFLQAGELVDDDVPLRAQPRKTVEKAVKKVYGTAWAFVNRTAILDYIFDGTTPDGDARRYCLNQARTSKGKWMDGAVWRSLQRVGVELGDGDLVGLGFDGGRRRDSTALVACRLRDRLIVPLAVWERPDRVGEWEVPAAEVDAAVAAAFGRFKVARMYGDPPHWREELAAWAREHGDEVVAEWPTYVDKRMSMALERFGEAVATGQLGHAGHAALTRHVLNAETASTKVWVEEDRRGFRLIKPHGVDEGSPRAMIDLAVAAVMAHEAACDAIADGALDAEGPSVYEDRGALVL